MGRRRRAPGAATRTWPGWRAPDDVAVLFRGRVRTHDALDPLELAAHHGRAGRGARDRPVRAAATPGSSPATRSTPRGSRSRGGRRGGSSSGCRSPTAWSSTSRPAGAWPSGGRGRRAGRPRSSPMRRHHGPGRSTRGRPRTFAMPSGRRATARSPSRDATDRWCCRSGGGAGRPRAGTRPSCRHPCSAPRGSRPGRRPVSRWTGRANGAPRRCPACSCVDGRSCSRRSANEVKALRDRVPEGWALVRLRPSSVVWWRGWTSGTVAAS